MFTHDELLLGYALRMVGLPYIWGGASPLVGFDCSGLVMELLAAGGRVKHGTDASSQALYNHLRSVGQKPLDVPKFGALAFYGRHKADITHVGFCLGDTLMLEAAGGDKTTKTATDAKLRNACVRVRPIRYRADLMDVLMP